MSAKHTETAPATYLLASMVGEYARGIPSIDAAIALAVDDARYNDDEMDADDGSTLAGCRRDVQVELYEYEEGLGPPGGSYNVILADGREYLAVQPEHRCPTCKRPGWRPCVATESAPNAEGAAAIHIVTYNNGRVWSAHSTLEAAQAERKRARETCPDDFYADAIETVSVDGPATNEER